MGNRREAGAGAREDAAGVTGEDGGERLTLPFKKRLSATDLELLTAVDHHGHEALVAVDAESGVAVGVARMLREAGRPDTAEASVAVVDAWQGRGLGGMLLERLVTRAREEGVRRFTSVLLTRNLAMLRLFGRTGSVRVTARYGESLELEVELPFETGAPREALRAAAAGEVLGRPRRVPHGAVSDHLQRRSRGMRA